MLRSLQQMLRYHVRATDGDVGTVQDFLLDEDEWKVRYVVIDTAEWLFGRRVLLSPDSVKDVDWVEKRFDFSVTKEKIESSPTISTDLPISRQKELSMAKHYGWPQYWIPAGPPRPQPGPALSAIPDDPGEVSEDSGNLRSLREILRYGIHAKDGEMGKASDLIADDESWRIRYLVVDTGTWLPGKRVLVSRDWIDGISWAKREIRLDLEKKEVEKSPEYDPNEPVNREYETVLYDYYGRPHYWRKS